MIHINKATIEVVIFVFTTRIMLHTANANITSLCLPINALHDINAAGKDIAKACIKV